MHINLKTLLLAILIAGISPFASAISLGEGQIQSNVGEPFLANIALMGDYDKNVKFSQVGNSECRSSIVGRAANGCDSLYEGLLTFSVNRRHDGRYFLRVTGEKSDELFYRIIIKNASASSGTAFKAFEFLPEFKADADDQPMVVNKPSVNSVPHRVKQDVVSGRVADVQPDNANVVSAKNAHAQVASSAVRAKLPDETGRKQIARTVEVQPAAKKTAETRLQIKKSGEYADDIHALQKENVEIQEQIALLEKHIGLLREVIRLKGEAGASSVAETGVIAAAPVSVQVPVLLPVLSLPATRRAGTLTWVLLAVVLALSALLWWMYRKMKSFKSSNSNSEPEQHVFAPSRLNVKKSLDLTGTFAKPTW